MLSKNSEENQDIFNRNKKKTKKAENIDLNQKRTSRAVATDLDTVYQPPHATKLPNIVETRLKSQNELEDKFGHFAQKTMKFIKKLDTRSRKLKKSGWGIIALLKFELTKADNRDKMSIFGSIENIEVQLFINNFFEAIVGFVSYEV